ncbi:MAG: A24 family peptidase [Acidobacteria bacterium]|nr:A24 family peptidase [Acidobacteriota bacterium]
MRDPVSSQVVVWGLASLLALLAGWLDWRSRRIPNWLTVPGFVLGLSVNAAFGGWSGIKAGLEGAGLGLGLLFLPVLLRGMGAGDWKLMGALGACLGPRQFLQVLLINILIVGLMAIVEMVRRRRAMQTLRNLGGLLRAFVTFGIGVREGLITLDNPTALRLPFGVATALAVVILVCTKSTLRTL